MGNYELAVVDVFSDRVFGGNPLAVVLGGEDLPRDRMQKIAREMNLSETVFILPAERPGAAARLRIFTPAIELPFAGHPTLGAAYVLATRGLLPSGACAIVLEEAIGPVPVTLEDAPDAPSFLWMEHRPAAFAEPMPERSAIAAALGLPETALRRGAPVLIGSTGLPYLFVPLAGRAEVDAAVLNVPAILDLVPVEAANGVFVFSVDEVAGVTGAYSRMFAPHTAGIAEDPATGSASGALGVYLLRQGLIKPAAELRLVSEQGTKMGRKSLVHIRLRLQAGEVAGIEVGGTVTPVWQGTLRLP